MIDLKVLGRAKELSDFVKFGCESGSVEICLKEDSAPYYVKLKRNIKSSKNNSDWFINGQQTTLKEIQRIVNRFGIQVDNLCQFLPQDKVADFARLDPKEQLLETLRAAGEEDALAQRERLVSLFKKNKEISASLSTEKSILENLQKQNKLLEFKVQKFKEREEHLKIVDLCQRKRPWMEYNEARDECMKKKQEKQVIKIAVDKLSLKIDPLKEKLKELENSQEADIERYDALRKEVSAAPRVNSDLKANTESFAKLKIERERMEERKLRRKEELTRLGDEIEELRAQIMGLISEDPDVYKEQLNSVFQRLANIEAENERLISQQDAIKAEGEVLTRSINGAHSRLRLIEDTKNQRLSLLKAKNRHTFEAVMWLRENQHLFKKKIFEPPFLEVQVKDERFASEIEGFFNKQSMNLFVSQCKEDTELFLAELSDRRNLRLNIQESDSSLSEYRPRVPVDVIKSLGFHDYIINLIDAPEPILAVLCQTANLHLIPVTKQQIDESKLEKYRDIQRYCIDGILYEVKRSAYSNDSITRSRRVRPSEVFKETLNVSERDEVLLQIENFRKQLAQNAERMKYLLQSQSEVRSRAENVKQEESSINSKLLEIRRIDAKRNDLENCLSHKLKELDNMLNENITQEREQQLEKEMNILLKQRIKFCEGMKDLAGEKFNSFCEMAKIGLQMASFNMEKMDLVEQISQLEREYNDAKRAFDNLDEEFNSLKAKAKVLLMKAQRQEVDEETKESFAQLPDSVDELDILIASESTKAEMKFCDDDDNVHVEYRKREQQILQMTEAVEEKEKDATKMVSEMQKIEEKWKPRLEAVVAKINEKFSAYFKGFLSGLIV